MGHVQVFLGQKERAQAGGISTVGLMSQMLDFGETGDAESERKNTRKKRKVSSPTPIQVQKSLQLLLIPKLHVLE